MQGFKGFLKDILYNLSSSGGSYKRKYAPISSSLIEPSADKQYTRMLSRMSIICCAETVL
jgi:hypothetical protein